MQAYLSSIHDMRREAESLVFEGMARGMPMGVSRIVVTMTMQGKGLPVPDDILAFASEGQVSDKQVVDWDDPQGGLDIIIKKM